nr:tumor necrosis factor receptor superfamily member 5 isoform X2 [Pogona vitticeps]
MGRLLAIWLAAAWGSGALLACLALEQGPNCNATQYLQQMPSGDWCCSRCPPGQKVKTPCDGESDTVCQPCETEHFQAGWTKEKHCTPHTYCDPNAGFLLHVPGTATRDAECRCRNGTHCSSPECQVCRPSKPCGPGEGVQKEASHLEDTVCVECPEGFFSSVVSATAPCQPWSRCVDRNLVQKANGTRHSDVTCEEVRAATRPPPTSAPNREAGRTHLLALVLLPLGALVTMGAAFVIRHQKCKGGQKEPHDQGHRPNGRQQPAEVAFDDQLCPALPIQETLRGEQHLTPEDSKESGFAAQEQV